MRPLHEDCPRVVEIHRNPVLTVGNDHLSPRLDFHLFDNPHAQPRALRPDERAKAIKVLPIGRLKVHGGLPASVSFKRPAGHAKRTTA